jgi:hypothetical protein
MRSRDLRRVCLLATMTTLAALSAPSPRIALAQIPEAPGTFTNSNGSTVGQSPGSSGRRRRGAKPNSAQPTPDAAQETVQEMQRARARASGTPVPQPTPRGGPGSQ